MPDKILTDLNNFISPTGLPTLQANGDFVTNFFSTQFSWLDILIKNLVLSLIAGVFFVGIYVLCPGSTIIKIIVALLITWLIIFPLLFGFANFFQLVTL